MKIAYLIDYNINDKSGVVQKIQQNISQWIVKGHTVYFVSLKTMAIYDAEQNIIFQEKSISVNFGRASTAINLLYNSYYAYKLFEKIDVDLIYMRYRLYMPFINRLLKEHKVVMEINGDDTLEYKLHSQLTHYYNRFTRELNFKYIDAFISVSDELGERFMYLCKPIKIIGNGINTQEYSMEDTNNQRPILVFIATPNQPWQGLDKILTMTKHFVNYEFYIIGTEGNSIANLKYFGFLSKEASTNVIQKCDIGLGTLSLYRQGLTEASPLKTRQYLACGLPLIYAYEDTDIPDDVEFGLRLDNKENNMDYQKIEKFIQKVFNNKNISLEARKFSEEKLGYDKKEEVRLKFFERVLNEK